MNPEQEFAQSVTRGLWILPKRKREIQREILEHLEDVAEEKQIEKWSTKLIQKYFGSPKKLRNLYAKGGLPWWAKGLKWGLYFIAFIFCLVLALDLYVLWFYSIPPDVLRVVRSNEEFFSQFNINRRFELPESRLEWLEPGDTEAARLFDNLERCLTLAREYLQVEGNAEAEFNSQPHIAAKIQAATYPIQFPPGHVANEAGMGMGMQMIETLTDEEKQERETFVREKTKPVRDQIVTLWTQINPGDRMRFRRPEVTDADIGRFNEVLPEWNSAADNSGMVARFQMQNQQWLPTALNLYSDTRGKDVKTVIQTAKDLTFRIEWMLSYQQLHKTIKAALKDASAEDANRLIEATALWNKVYLEAVDPNPEPLIDLLIIVATSGIAYEMFPETIGNISEVSAFETAIHAFSGIPLAETRAKFPPLEELQSYAINTLDYIAVFYSQFSLFRVQCTLMQKFYPPNSDSYLHYKLMKQGIFLPFFSIAIPNFINAEVRMDVVIARQSLAESALALHKTVSENPAVETIDFRQYNIADPFQDGGIKLEVTDDTFRLSSAGPDRSFDTAIYSPSNGTTSRGDIVWELKRN